MAVLKSGGMAGNLILVVVLLLGLSSVWLAYAATPVADQSAAPVIPRAKGEKCVAETALMRTDHMEFLNHQRDETVIDGIRGEPFSLAGCVDCHAQTSADGTPLRIDAEGQFCESCHAYAAVKIDCFTCHAAKPSAEKLIGQRETHIDTYLASTRPFHHLKVRDSFDIPVDLYLAERHGQYRKANR